ncbi:hypothetical protein ACMFMF_000814 [Clarireedia jacksonii]
MTLLTGFLHPRLLRQYMIIALSFLLSISYLVGLVLIIRSLADGSTLWYIGLIFIIGLGVVVLQVGFWFLLVIVEHFFTLKIGPLLLRWWHLPRKKTTQLWLRYKFGSPKENGTIYSPLDQALNQIRLLVISPGGANEEITCNLLVTELGLLLPTYQALSYTWGSNYSPRHILLNNSSFMVAPNLYSALKYLRRDHMERVVWIDALCIDQSNISERGEQVLLMREIYSRAAETIIWLGEGTPSSNLAMHYLSLADKVPDPEDWFIRGLRRDFMTKRSEWNAILQLFNMDYWGRVWIIQEIAVSSELKIACGQYVIPWNLAVAAQNSWVNFRASTLSKSIQVAIEIMEGVTSK